MNVAGVARPQPACQIRVNSHESNCRFQTPSINRHLIAVDLNMNQARLDEIRNIVLTSRDVKSFYESFLATVARMSKARIGVAWDCTHPPFHPICQIQPKTAQPMQMAISEQKHMELLNRAAQNSRSFIVQIRADENGNSAGQPVLMFGPIRRDSQIELVEFILPNDYDQEACQQVLEELDEFCSIASQFEEKTGCEHPIHTASSPTAPTRGIRSLSGESIDQYAHTIHGSLDFKETARTIANEARRVLDCDRVSVALKQGSKFKLLAISGQPSVNRRSNTVHQLSQLITKALATEQAFWYPSDEQLPPQLEQPLNAYLGFSATRSLAILPIFDRQIQENNDPNKSPQPPKVVAGLIVEHCNEQWNRAQAAPSIETASRHAADAMRNALSHRQLFGYSVWRLLGKSRVVTASRNLPKTVAFFGVLVLAIIALTMVPAPFTLHSEGILLPQTRRKVFAEIDGQVAQIDVQHGSQVAEGETLLTLTNFDLQDQLEQISGEIDALSQRLKSNKALRLENRNSNDKEAMLDNDGAIKSQIESLEKRQTTIQSKLSKLSVDSPINGEIITWDVSDRLRNRPVTVGDLLLEVADVDGDWEIELNLPDRRIGHLLRELKTQKETGNNQGIKVTYQLAADPSRKFTGQLKQVAQATQLTADQKQGVKVVVEIDTNDIDDTRQARSGVSAKIHCGYEPLGYVWLHDIFEFVQAEILFRVW